MYLDICVNLERYFWRIDGTGVCGDGSFGHGRCVWASADAKCEFNGVKRDFKGPMYLFHQKWKRKMKNKHLKVCCGKVNDLCTNLSIRTKKANEEENAQIVRSNLLW